MILGIIIFLSVLAGVCYRLGGIGDNPQYNWIPLWLRETWVRDWVIPFLSLITTWLIIGFQFNHIWAYLLFWGAQGGALTTYWDELFGFDNFWFNSFCIGLATVFIAWPIGNLALWLTAGLYAILLGTVVGAVSKIIKDDDWGEFFRGFPIIVLWAGALFICKHFFLK